MEILLHKTNISENLGRAGRRGKDKGNVVFFGEIDYFNLMKSGHPNIVGSVKPIYDNYRALPNASSTLFSNMINNERKNTLKIQKHLWMRRRKILWGLRKYKNACYFVNNLFNIEKNFIIE